MTEHGLVNPNQTRAQLTALHWLVKEIQTDDVREEHARSIVRAVARVMLAERFGGFAKFLKLSRKACGREVVDDWFGNLKSPALSFEDAKSVLASYPLAEAAESAEVPEDAFIRAAAVVMPRLVGLLTISLSNTGAVFSLVQML